MEIEQNGVQKRLVANFEEAMEYSAGPKGYGKYQIYNFVSIVLGMVAGAFFLYSINYFEMAPAYLCQYEVGGEYTTCTSDDFCKSDTDVVNWEIDWSDERSLHNWVEQLDLYCTSTTKIGYIGSSFFAGTFLGSFILPPLGDILGRKLIHMTGLSLFIVVITCSYFVKSLNLLYVLLVLGGISETGRYYVAYVYCVEQFPKRLQTNVGLSIFMVFGFAKVIINVQFWVLDKYWTTNLVIAMVCAVLGWVMVLFTMSESVPYNYSIKNYDEVRRQLIKMQKVNGVDIVEFSFQEEKDAQERPEDIDGVYKKLDQSDNPSASVDMGIDRALTQADETPKTDAAQRGNNLKQLYQNGTYLRNLSIMAFIWAFGSFSFFMVPYYLVQEPGKVFQNLLATESSELIGTLICFAMTSRLPLKQSIVMLCFLSIVSAFSLVVLDPVNQATGYYIGVQITYLGVLCVFDLCYVIVCQLFHSDILSSAYGICNIFARFITILAPSVAVIPNPWPMMILIVFGGVSGLFGSFLVIINKEVKH